MNFFFHFWGFFQKVFKKWSSLKKNYFIFFHFLWGGQTQKWKFSLYFFLTLPLMIVAHPFSSIHDVTMTAAVLPRLAA